MLQSHTYISRGCQILCDLDLDHIKRLVYFEGIDNNVVLKYGNKSYISKFNRDIHTDMAMSLIVYIRPLPKPLSLSESNFQHQDHLHPSILTFKLFSLLNCVMPSPIAQWESARPNLDLPKIEARSEVSS